MPSVCLYFQVHQPYRPKRYQFFSIGEDHDYFDDESNASILRKVAEKCYLPTNKKLLELIQEHNGKFRIAFSLSGTAIEQLEKWAPEVIESYKELVKTGCVEFLSETYYHSLAYLYSNDEFIRQVKLHKDKIKQLFGVSPTVFRNTELIYDNDLPVLLHDMGYKATVAEGVYWMIKDQDPNHVFAPVKQKDFKLLLRNYKLSDDIAFRFSDPHWHEYPIDAKKYAGWLAADKKAEVFNIFIDYETFGEHQWEHTGIFEFLSELPGEVLKHPTLEFHTPSEVAETHQPITTFHAQHITSWADTEKDLSAWRHNAMQYETLERIYELGPRIKKMQDPVLLQVWSKLQTCDHFY